jgi:TonB family protein
LWQSTLFAAAAGLLTLPLRQNQARVRHALWLTASLKFLVPFSWLIVIGNWLAFLRGTSSDGAHAPFLLRQFVQIVAQSVGGGDFWPVALAMVWIAGTVTVLCVWCLRWRKAALAMKNSSQLQNGHEVEALREVASASEIRICLAKSSLEPGIFGIFHPVLLWPEGLSDRLSAAQLRSVIAHEVCHIRRRDNLAAVLQMLVEALFWFYPLVWWIGARLIEERERSCDEEVLKLGSEPQVYAESILKVCEFCVEAPLACISGVTGADLKKRMVHIMTDRVAKKLGLSKKLMLSAAGFLALATPVVFGMFNATPSLAEGQEQNASEAQGTELVHVRKDIMQGLIIPESKVSPKYPDEAKKARIQGTVVLDATISKKGDVENLQITSGHPILVPAAIDAVKQWKYKPFLLNGKPVEVQTQIEVKFTLAD